MSDTFDCMHQLIDSINQLNQLMHERIQKNELNNMTSLVLERGRLLQNLISYFPQVNNKEFLVDYLESLKENTQQMMEVIDVKYKQVSNTLISINQLKKYDCAQ